MNLIANSRLKEVLPEALLVNPQWVIWQYEERDGERTKVPYRAVSGLNGQHQRAKSNDASTWSNFDSAYGIASPMSDRFGIGFMLHGSPFVGIDFDGIVKDGKPEVYALAILDLLGDPYTEVTPSGNGLRAFVECPALPKGKRRFTRSEPEKYGAEIYSGAEGGRFLTVTGNKFSGEGVPKLEDISLPYFLITQILDEKFKALWVGDTSGYDGDDSRADLALCGLIARALGKDASHERIESAFGESALGQRSKWTDREDYRRRTIEAAMKGGAPESESEFHRTELGNAKRLVAKFGADIRFNHEQKKWYEWTGAIWTRDRKATMKNRMKEISHDMLEEAVHSNNPDERDALAKWALKAESEKVINGSLALAASEVPVLTEEFDRSIHLLNVANGTIDLQTGKFGPHQREDMLTSIAAVEYDAAAKCPRWEQFLQEVVDPETIPFLQRAVGYSLTGSTVEHCFFLIYGLGRNGKSTFLSIIQYVLGDYAMQTDWQSFAVSKNGGVQVRNDIARLHGARFVAAIESEKNVRLAESLIKALTGGDKITARFLYQEAFEFHPQLKLWLATNHKPRVTGTDEAIWSRIKLIPFNVTIPTEKRDRHLTDKLKMEAAGILNWALEGLRLYQQDGLHESKAVSDATELYRANSDVLQHFLDAKCTLAAGGETQSSVLYAAYKSWVDESGEYQLNERDFGTAMEERGLKRSRIGARKDKPSGVYWHGVVLSNGQNAHQNTESTNESAETMDENDDIHFD